MYIKNKTLKIKRIKVQMKIFEKRLTAIIKDYIIKNKILINE